jgi:hypothetical protein
MATPIEIFFGERGPSSAAFPNRERLPHGVAGASLNKRAKTPIAPGLFSRIARAWFMGRRPDERFFFGVENVRVHLIYRRDHARVHAREDPALSEHGAARSIASAVFETELLYVRAQLQ